MNVDNMEYNTTRNPLFPGNSRKPTKQTIPYGFRC